MQHNITTDAVWHGTQGERLDFLQAIARNCECQVDGMGVQLEAPQPKPRVLEGPTPGKISTGLGEYAS